MWKCQLLSDWLIPASFQAGPGERRKKKKGKKRKRENIRMIFHKMHLTLFAAKYFCARNAHCHFLLLLLLSFCPLARSISQSVGSWHFQKELSLSVRRRQIYLHRNATVPSVNLRLLYGGVPTTPETELVSATSLLHVKWAEA